jgi:four helix bundle protein
MADFRKLEVWNLSMALVTEIYNVTSKYPKEEIYGITSQIRRCSVSIPSNIAEGSSNRTKMDFKRYLTISLGSAFELETQLIISKNLNFISKEKFEELIPRITQIQKMIAGLSNSLLK